MSALCGAILRFDAVLAEEITKALDLVAQGWKVQARRRPFLLAGGLLVQQSPFPVAQRRRVLEVPRPRGSLFPPAALPVPLVEAPYARPGAHKMLRGRQPRIHRVDAG